jgi:uncharacterized protein YciI
MNLYKLIILVILAINTLHLQAQENEVIKHPMYYVFLHTPGPNWQKGVEFQEQKGVRDHIKYMRNQLDEGLLLMGGPFLDNSGGMMICKTPDSETAKSIANADPAVVSGLLNVKVRKWMVPMSSLDLSYDKKK